LYREGIDPVVVRMELDYLYPLKSGDRFIVQLSLERKGRLKIIFHQHIIRLPDKKPVLCAKVIATCLKEGRPFIPDELVKAIQNIDTSMI
jgi:acyl-CoA thioester hydrolase